MGCSKSKQYGIDEELQEDIRRVEQYADHLVKCTLIGDVEVGKTALMMKMSENLIICEYLPTIGMDFRVPELERENGTKFKFQIWDSSGQDRFDTIRRSYLRGYNVLMCYDISNKESFNNIQSKWKREVDKYSFNKKTILIGLKCDLSNKRQITFEQGNNLAKQFKIPFFETSIYIDSKQEMIKNELCVMGYIRIQSDIQWFNIPQLVIITIKKYYNFYIDDYHNFTDIKTVFNKLGQLSFKSKDEKSHNDNNDNSDNDDS